MKRLSGPEKPVRAGDIMILVRTRGPFFEAVIRALKQNRIPVAGADRLELAEHIAVLDLVAAGRAALLPEDDLILAAVLKSPLIGLDDDDLLKIAPKRAGQSLRGAESRARGEFSETAGKETRRLARARRARAPFSFYSSLLCEDGGRRALEARLGPEAADAIDEFLRLALAHEAEAAPSLTGFPRRFRGGGALDPARHGKRRRCRARHDRACGEGARSQDRLSARYLRRAGAAA